MGEVSRANAERALTPVSLCERPLGEHPSPETGGMLLSAYQSYFPDRSRTYFILPCFTVPYWFLGTSRRCEDEGLSLERSCNNLVVFVCHCLILPPRINKFLWVHVICRVKEIDQIGNAIPKIESSLLYAHVLFCFGFFSSQLSPFVSLFSSASFISPVASPVLVRLLCLAFVCRKQRIWVCRLGHRRRWRLSVSPCGTLAVPYHVLLIPSL